MDTITDAAIDTIRTASAEPNDWAKRIHALIAAEGIDAGLGQSYADGMAFVCGEHGHPIHAGQLACLCGSHMVPTLESTDGH
jgi:hypothetical protein